MSSTAVRDGERERSLRRVLAIGFVGGLSLVAVTTLSTKAMFLGNTGNSGNTFTGGTVDLAPGTSSALVTMTAMLPGDKVTAPLTVDNGGSLDLRYSMTSTTSTTGDADLPETLVLTIKDDLPAASCTTAQWASGTDVVYTGPLGDDDTTTKVLGSSVPGPDPGDRQLASGAAETLCFQVQYPLTATAGEGSATTATFTFDAEQTKNNG